MKTTAFIAAMLALAGCASTSTERLGPGKETEAVRDFIIAGELRELNIIRLTEPIKYMYVNDHFVVVPQRHGDYLVEFRGRCTELRKRKYTADMIDIRVSARVLHADYDTIRGCKIGRIYELTEERLIELAGLGDAPGNEQYLGKEDQARP